MNETRPARRPPSIDEVLRTPTGALAATRFGHDATVNAIRQSVAAVRDAARASATPLPGADAIAARALQALEHADAPTLRPCCSCSTASGLTRRQSSQEAS